MAAELSPEPSSQPSSQHSSQPSSQFSLRPRQVIVAMDGVGGTGIMPQTLALAMRMAGTDHQVRKFFWTHGIGQPIKDLCNRENIEQRSLELYELLQSLLNEGARVQIVAKSGGSIIAVKALERLDPGSIDNVILLSPAISPGYDLSRALSAVDNKMLCFYSRLDVMYLRLGTTVFGTSDGVKGASAGCIGFDREYDKLEQVPWSPAMLKRLHIGMHLGNSMLPWLMTYAVPFLRGSACEGAESSPILSFRKSRCF